jgi:hypothetical protein
MKGFMVPVGNLSMIKTIKYGVLFGFLAGAGILLGCWIHGIRTNQPTIMSGVAFIRELPQGEQIVGRIETWWFGPDNDNSGELFGPLLEMDPKSRR